jgi:hypothetical protein
MFFFILSASILGAVAAVSTVPSTNNIVRRNVRLHALNLPVLEDKHSSGVVQKLTNEGDGVSYYGEVLIGGQKQAAVYDTGSFDIVVQGGCGKLSTFQCSSDVKQSQYVINFHRISQKRKVQMHKIVKGKTVQNLVARVSSTGHITNNTVGPALIDELEPDEDYDECEAFWKQAEATASAAGEGEPNSDRPNSLYTCCDMTKCPHASYLTGESGENFCMLDEKFDSITYGSGTVVTKLGADHIEFEASDGAKSIAKQKVLVKLVVNTDLALFQYFNFTTIFGIGPGPFLDKDDTARSSRPLYALGINRFTYCLDRDLNRGGLITWNDADHSHETGWKKVPVIGRSFWATGIFGFHLEGVPASNGCSTGCSGIIDTGSTLMIVPKAVATVISKAISEGQISDCSDLTKFPVLKFTLGMKGSWKYQLHEFHLGPESYLTDAGIQGADLAYKRVGKSHFPLLPMRRHDWLSWKLERKGLNGTSLVESQLHMCALALDTQPCEQNGPDGPEMILGMPLFHAYKVQFDLTLDQEGHPHSASNPTRFMHLGEKSGSACDETAESSSLRDESNVPLRKMDIWKVPQWLGHKRVYEWGH